MRVLLLIIAIVCYAQPLQAGHCDMESGQTMAMHLEHGVDVEHDCCEGDEAADANECRHAIQCGSCFSSVFSFQSAVPFARLSHDSHTPDRMAGALSPSHSAPLLRPPIS